MSSVGPALPPHLAKRKRTPDDEAPADSPPTKIHASENERTNREEIELESESESESESDDEYGPSAPKTAALAPAGPLPPPPPSAGPTRPPRTSIGPSLPEKNPDEVALDDEDDEPTGPSATLPPTNAPRRSIGPTLPSTNTNEIPLESEDEDDVGPAPPEPKRIHGPAPPPAALSERPPVPADSESDSDDDYGPALPTSASHQQRQARALKAAETEAATNQAPKRDDWMLAPPSASGPREADPTKLKARRFNSGPRANTSNSGGEISSIWTETPEQKRKRLENAVLGRNTGSGPTSQTSTKSAQTKTKEQAEQEARIQSFTEATRGRSLYEEHQEARAQGPNPRSTGATKKSWVDEEEDDPSKRAFDREKDLKLGGRIGASQRRELLNKAADFGGRFAKGKYL